VENQCILHNSIVMAISLSKKLSKLVEICEGYEKNNSDCFLETWCTITAVTDV